MASPADDPASVYLHSPLFHLFPYTSSHQKVKQLLYNSWKYWNTKLNKSEMSEAPACQLRRRRTSGNPNLPLTLEVGYQVNEGGPAEGTPSPSKITPNSRRTSAAALLDFKNKMQSFDIQVEECEEEEITIDSDDEGGPDDNGASGVNRPVTPMPIQDFGANVVHSEGPQTTDFLKVKAIEQDCYTDVSDADSEIEEE